MSQSLDGLLPQWGVQKIWKFHKRVKGEVPGSRRQWGWLSTWLVAFEDDTDERRVQIKLPFYGHTYSIASDDVRWGQLTFQYCGQRGFFIMPIIVPENKNG